MVAYMLLQRISAIQQKVQAMGREPNVLLLGHRSFIELAEELGTQEHLLLRGWVNDMKVIRDHSLEWTAVEVKFDPNREVVGTGFRRAWLKLYDRIAGARWSQITCPECGKIDWVTQHNEGYCDDCSLHRSPI